MIRTFQEHEKRQTKLLNGAWSFVVDPHDVGLKEQWYKQFPESSRSMFVPSCWNNEIGLYDYEGVAWYRTTFTLPSSEHVRLIFHGILNHANVYLDGEHLGYHYGGFSPFNFTIPSLSAGNHELIVRTDSKLDEATIPYHYVDWYHYGGIIRPVELQTLPDVFIENFQVDYNQDTNLLTTADVNITVQLRSLVDTTEQVPVKVGADTDDIYNQTVSIGARKTKHVNIKQRWENLRLWNVGAPELYKIRVDIEKDDKIDRIGFRLIDTLNGKIRINHEEIYFQGINRHEEHPEWGFAFPAKLMTKDLDIVEEMGCNAVRGSHYPQSKYWIDLLDERGIAYWSEIPIWGAHLPVEPLANPVVIERASHMIDEMIDRDIHHPSILFWSVHNEIKTHSKEAYDLSVTLINRVKNKDQSRLITYATMDPLNDITLPLFDVIGINKYHGWYEGKVDGFKHMLENFHAYADKMGAGDKPVMMTEFGGAGIYGDTGWENRLFSEDYQAEIVGDALHIFNNDPKIVGTFVWQFADIRADLQSHQPHFRDRARGFNNKGLVNEYRKPKQAFRVVREIYKNSK
ncbi:glycoside hydrolase family 2 protein [Radiobacillus sp. PE A8.2]|uniref:glycoside hydrolase family 2 protein n=1 Tax=Radiobacillus sp. PE A8.2 TaxID=3380349 RepID=UPI003890C2ED